MQWGPSENSGGTYFQVAMAVVQFVRVISMAWSVENVMQETLTINNQRCSSVLTLETAGEFLKNHRHTLS